MRNSTNIELRETVERYIRERFNDAMIDSIIINEGFDEDSDRIVNVIVVFNRDERVTGFSSLARNMWSELSRKDYGFPILSFRTSDENTRLLATA